MHPPAMKEPKTAPAPPAGPEQTSTPPRKHRPSQTFSVEGKPLPIRLLMYLWWGFSPPPIPPVPDVRTLPEEEERRV